jgi:hypothetical protein
LRRFSEVFAEVGVEFTTLTPPESATGPRREKVESADMEN